MLGVVQLLNVLKIEFVEFFQLAILVFKFSNSIFEGFHIKFNSLLPTSVFFSVDDDTFFLFDFLLFASSNFTLVSFLYFFNFNLPPSLFLFESVLLFFWPTAAHVL